MSIGYESSLASPIVFNIEHEVSLNLLASLRDRSSTMMAKVLACIVLVLLLNLELDGLGPLVVAIPLVNRDDMVVVVVPWDFITELVPWRGSATL